MDASTAAYWQTIFQGGALGAGVITLGFLIWYAIETYRLRIESQRQTALMLRPFVIAELVRKKTPIDNVFLNVHNIGNGAAVNIQIRGVNEGWKIAIPYLAPNSSQTFDVMLVTGSYEPGLSKSGTLIIGTIAEQMPLPVSIEFDNAEKQRYSVSETVRLNQLEVTDSKRLPSETDTKMF